MESGKQQIKEVRRKFKQKTWKERQLLSESGFVLRIAPPSLSRDRRIKIKKEKKKEKMTYDYPVQVSMSDFNGSKAHEARTFRVIIIFLS